jgi:hypothetical protein
MSTAMQVAAATHPEAPKPPGVAWSRFYVVGGVSAALYVEPGGPSVIFGTPPLGLGR